LKEKGEFEDTTIDALRDKQMTEMEEACKDIYQEYNVNEFFLQEWLQKYQDDHVIKEIFAKLEKLEGQVFNTDNQRIDYVPCENLPADLDEDKYILIYRKQQECVRHGVHKILKETGGSQAMNPEAHRDQ